MGSLLKQLKIERCNQVWCGDITYIPVAQGFVYLVAIMDWFSRFVLSWAISLTMEVEFCWEALGKALRQNGPEIFNGDQGSLFTSEQFLNHPLPIDLMPLGLQPRVIRRLP
jgi:putative transposase